ncbi:MAG: polysaccharide deacetylase family protein [Clostridiales Family XIII bacterium]|jgi:peptidoglycan/xylan/chitin deacetylase (PgdA/CDA1 family)|nr:polysaccharide deacetylase family protein [Clostridiales Family XIII bacterium]
MKRGFILIVYLLLIVTIAAGACAVTNRVFSGERAERGGNGNDGKQKSAYTASDRFTRAVKDGNAQFVPKHPGVKNGQAGNTKIPKPVKDDSATVVPPVPIDPARPMIALTFDDGPSQETFRIVALLKQYGGRATFCVVGDRIERFQDAMREAAAQQCEIIGHSWDHRNLTKLSDAEIRDELVRTNDLIHSVSGQRPTMYRPPYGAVDDRVKGISAQEQLAVVLWSVDTMDWKTRSADQTYKSIMGQVGSGNIVLCHDLYPQTADAMERVIPELAQQGYQLVTISELLRASGKEIVPGEVYNRANR